MSQMTIPPALYAVTSGLGQALSLAIAVSEMTPDLSTDSYPGRELEVTSYLIDVQRNILEKIRGEANRLEGELLKIGLAP